MSDEKPKITYLAVDGIITLNKYVITEFPKKKGDKHILKSRPKLEIVFNETLESQSDDIYDKAVVLLKGIVKCHAFASGNRRTALIATLVFLHINNQKLYIPNEPANSRVFVGIREGYYKDSEIKEWIQHGKIRPFKRSFE